LNIEASEEAGKRGSGLPGRIALVVPPSALSDLPSLPKWQPLLSAPGQPSADPIADMRHALSEESKAALDGIEAIVVLAPCQPLLGTHAAGTVYRAVDFVNAMGDNPLIGSRSTDHKSFFVNMTQPFAHDLFGCFNAVPEGAIVDAVLGGWPMETPLDDSDRAWLQSIGVDIASPHGVSEAIAARALGIHCMALFYSKGDREGAQYLSALLAEVVSSDRDSFESIS
jgi:hypothetical protein